MIVGIDFDNTIVCYDALFHKIARERNLIPADLPINKSEVRNCLRRAGHENIWTEMQGSVYGGRMAEAAPYPGVLGFFQRCRNAGIELRIISHKTRHPFLGEKYDLHEAAGKWIERHGFFDQTKIGLPREHVFFELTREEKLQRIARCGCTHFIDDLPEVLSEPSFPESLEKILFDPANIYSAEKFARFQTWSALQNYFLPSGGDIMDRDIRDKSASLLFPHVKNSGFEIGLLRGGGNNRVYRITTKDQVFALKEYFQNPADSRDRFAAERAFYDFLREQGIDRSPRSLGWDTEKRLGLFEFVDGRKLARNEFDASHIEQSAQFIHELNRGNESIESDKIPVASEACFSIGEHLDCVERRIARLQQIDSATKIDVQATAFLRGELEPAWEKVRQKIVQHAGNEISRQIARREKCLSPSDFGFHNALLTEEGKLLFFDFEYAGWDDPAKLICDFFCQPQIPVELNFWKPFVQLVSSQKNDSTLERRAAILLPAYQIKWCCIMLNEFIRGDQARRDFAKGPDSVVGRKAAQLEKARQTLRQLVKLDQ